MLVSAQKSRPPEPVRGLLDSLVSSLLGAPVRSGTRWAYPGVDEALPEYPRQAGEGLLPYLVRVLKLVVSARAVEPPTVFWDEVQNKDHDHDDRYYTREQIDGMLAELKSE